MIIMFKTISNIKPLLRLLRPKQWIKNTFVLTPLLFSYSFGNLVAVVNSVIAFALFCIASSSTYLLNDIKDVNQDRLHPVKSVSRPIASGEVASDFALFVLFLLYLVLIGAYLIDPNVLRVIAIYIGINYLYTFFLKHEPILDIFVIALGFVLRVYAGTQAIHVAMSSWIFVTTLCLALYMASIKRRQELIFHGERARKSLKNYSVGLVERYAEMSATGALVFYSMYVVEERPQLLFSIPVVMFGLFRYWYLVNQKGAGESPTDSLLEDWQLILTVVAWVVMCITLMGN